MIILGAFKYRNALLNLHMISCVYQLLTDKSKELTENITFVLLNYYIKENKITILSTEAVNPVNYLKLIIKFHIAK